MNVERADVDIPYVLASKVFDYFNGVVNKRNICTLDIAFMSTDKIAAFYPPNKVILYMGSLMCMLNKLCEKLKDRKDLEQFTRDYVMSNMVNSIVHELFHADQEIDFVKYTTSTSYRNIVEYSVIQEANRYCVENKEELKESFGFNYREGLVQNYKVLINIDNKYHYQEVNLGDRYILDLTYLLGSSEMVDSFKKFYKEIPTFILEVSDVKDNNKIAVLLKRDDMINNSPEDYEAFTRFISKYSKVPESRFKIKYKYKATEYTQNNTGKHYCVFSLIIDRFSFNPIFF